MSEINVGAISEQLNNKADLDLNNLPSNYDYVVKTYKSGTTWYRKYKSGWIEQGGLLSNTSSAAHTVTLPVAMKDTNYSLMVTLKANTVSGSGGSWVNGTIASTTQITIVQDYATTWVGQGSYWVVAGYAA
jgi:hypothetical protein